MAQSKPRFPIWFFVTLAHAPVLFGYFFLVWGYALVVAITVVEPPAQETGADLATALLYLAGMVFFPLLFILATVLIWKNFQNIFIRGASLYGSLLILAGVMLFFFMSSIGGISMASVDGSGPDTELMFQALSETAKFLLFSQCLIVPWTVGATVLFQRNYSLSV